jgi:hypothetical protein
MISETIGSMDAAVEPTGTYSRRVAEVISLLATVQQCILKTQNLFCPNSLFHNNLMEILRLRSGRQSSPVAFLKTKKTPAVRRGNDACQQGPQGLGIKIKSVKLIGFNNDLRWTICLLSNF